MVHASITSYTVLAKLKTEKISFLIIIVKMQNIRNLISGNSVDISDTSNCYSENISGMLNARKLDGVYKIFKLILT